VDPAVLGECSEATHNKYALDGGDGYRYHSWHPQTDPSGCTYAHEHGEDVRTIGDATLRASFMAQPFLFGYVARSMQSAAEPTGHQEAHEGYKQFLINRAQANDEGRASMMWQGSLFHMGTGGPRRFEVRHHSAAQRYYHPGENLRASIQIMMDTGGIGSVCDPRVGISKDGFMIPRLAANGQPCAEKIRSAYEIWTTEAPIFAILGGVAREVYRAFATPAVFDPITLRLASDPLRVIFAWDDMLKPFREHPGDDWTGFRGCDRESYAQPGLFRAAGTSGVVYTDAMGQPLPATHPLALRQEFTATENTDARGSTIQTGSKETKGNHAFKLRTWECGSAAQKAKLGLKN
jgi:hypothetical protein